MAPARRVATNGARTPARFHPSQPPRNKGDGYTLVLGEAITFECQKIILAALFSHISAAAKARSGHGGRERK